MDESKKNLQEELKLDEASGTDPRPELEGVVSRTSKVSESLVMMGDLLREQRSMMGLVEVLKDTENKDKTNCIEYENVTPDCLSPIAEQTSVMSLYKRTDENVENLLGMSSISNGDYLIKYPLHYSVLQGDTKFLESLVKQGGLNIDGIDNIGLTAARYAIRRKRHECLLILMNGGANPDSQDSVGDTLLHTAASTGDLISLLILNRGNPDYKKLNRMGLPPAMAAFQGRNTQVIDYLWKKTKDVTYLINHKTRLGHSYVHLSAAYGDSIVLNKVLQFMPRVILPLTEAGELTPLHVSIMSGIVANVKELFKFCPLQIYLWNSEGELPIHKARNLEIIEYFYEVDKSVLTLSNVKNRKQLIHYLCEDKMIPLISFMLYNFPECWECEDDKKQTWNMILGNKLSQEMLNDYTKKRNLTGDVCGRF